VITMPNMYARGILFGKMILELGDSCTARNEAQGYSCDLEFKTKVRNLCLRSLRLDSHHQTPGQGFFSGMYNAVTGRVRKHGTDIGEISGRWSHVMEFKDNRVCPPFLFPAATQRRHSLRQARNVSCLTCPRTGSRSAPSGSHQRTSKSRTSLAGLNIKAFCLSSCSHVSWSRLWLELTAAILSKDMEKATEAKGAVEDAQRELRRKMAESGEKHVPRFFEQRDGHWVPKITCVAFAFCHFLSDILHALEGYRAM
jgi:hypothetical protein